MSISANLSSSVIDAEAELGSFLAIAGGAGAVISFCGIARPSSSEGAEVTELHLDHYPGMTERSLARIAQDGTKQFEVSHVRVVHRCGTIRPGEVIVFVAAASAHRRAAFLAADYLMDRLKTEAVFWKREQGIDGARWIEPTEADRADRERWNN
jgi:molybdopterin synthase catalytic subunit